VNLFNRLLIILLDLLLLVSAGAVFLVAFGLLHLDRLAGAPWFQDRLAPLTRLDRGTQATTVLLSLAFLLLGLVLLFFELRPPSRGDRRMVLKEDGLGRVTVSRALIPALVDREATRVPGVTESRSQVEEEKGQLMIRTQISVDPEINLPERTQELQQQVKEAVEHHLGRPVASVSVDAHLESVKSHRLH